MEDMMDELLIKVERLRNLIRDYVTNYEISKNPAEESRLKGLYTELRTELMESEIAPLLPRSIKTHDTLASYNQTMKTQGGYVARRAFIEKEFESILSKPEDGDKSALDVSMDTTPEGFGTGQRITNGQNFKPVFGPPRDEDQFHCDIFVIMPFATEFQSVYKNVILTIGKELNLRIYRGDDFQSDYHIIDEIWSAMNFARLVIADCTGNNANVFYELGMAHTLGKPTILITQSVDKAPFDVQSRRLIRYENTIAGADGLKSDLRTAINQVLSNGS